MNALVLARLQGRELLRRRLALVLLVAMPLSFFLLTFYSEDTSQPRWSTISGAIGMGFAVAGAALFSMLAARGIDPRLVLAGWRPAQIIIGRLLLLQVMGVAIGTCFVLVMLPLWQPPHPAALILAILAVDVVSVSIGLTIAALVPRELEGTLLVITIVGLQMSIPVDSDVATYTPLYGAMRLLRIAAEGGAITGPILHALGYAAALLLIAGLAWYRRLRMRVADHGLAPHPVQHGPLRRAGQSTGPRAAAINGLER